jgi:hypothetical protein
LSRDPALRRSTAITFGEWPDFDETCIRPPLAGREAPLGRGTTQPRLDCLPHAPLSAISRACSPPAPSQSHRSTSGQHARDVSVSAVSPHRSQKRSRGAAVGLAADRVAQVNADPGHRGRCRVPWQPAKHGAVALRGATGGHPVVELHHKSRLDALVRNKRCRADGILLSPRRHLYTGARLFRALVSPHSPHQSSRAGTSLWAVKTTRTGSRASTARPAYVLASRSFSLPTALSWGYPAPGPDGSVYETGENAVVYAVSGTGAIRWQQTEGIRRRSHRASCRCSAHQVGHRRRGL